MQKKIKNFFIHAVTGLLIFAVYYLLNIFAAYYISKLFDIYSFSVLTVLVILIDAVVTFFSIDILNIEFNRLYYVKIFIIWIFNTLISCIFFWSMFIIATTF